MKKITLKLKSILVLVVLLTASFGYSQNLLLGFETGESGGVNGGPFGNMPAPVVEAGTLTNTSQVLKIVGSASPEPWQGINLNLTSPVGLTTTKTMTMDVLSFTPITFLVKVNGGVSGAPEAAAEVTHNGNGQWQTLSFTFNTALDGKAPMANGIYNSFVIHAYWKAGETSFFPNVTTPARTFYVDNIKGPLGVPPVEPVPTVAAPTPPNRNAADVISIFSNAYANITIDNWNAAPIWYAPTGKVVQDVMIAGNATKKVDHAGDGFIGVDFSTLANHKDLSAMERFHMDIWTSTATLDKSYNLKLSNFKADNTGELNAIEFSTTNGSNPALPNPNPGTWISLDMPLSAWTVGARNNIAQFIVTSNLGIVYFDNVYIYKGTALGTSKFETSSVKMYPNPVKNTLTIEANSEIQRVSVYNILGQEVLKASPKSNRATLQTNELQKGVYMVTTEIDGKVSTSKVVKE
ncbi:T9SS type A sorting domain-containing protein [Flavobacterium nackdongense]|uniref:T9SS type A sorting domain-containing protein n=1 Tax=Flavobacterium nackdongense TaxID=2547394 RepID=A0A4P6Y6L6_9FLAO|nr:T9SS type A sorting domain-containing protein [Flavobacterium nackdongense]QBN18069.1 T9SS type A sorting domain-containing protein [Flavobacterium nackdongense]